MQNMQQLERVVQSSVPVPVHNTLRTTCATGGLSLHRLLRALLVFASEKTLEELVELGVPIEKNSNY